MYNSGWITASSVAIPAGILAWNTTYYWHVYTYDGYTQTNPNWVWSFTPSNSPPPTPTLSSPPNGVTITSTTPQLAANPVADPDGDTPVSYWFRVASGTDGQSGNLVESGWITSASWTPPVGALQDGGTYTWTVEAKDPYGATSAWSAVWSFHVDLRLGTRASYGEDSLGPVTVNLASGNATASYSAPAIATVGGPLGVSFAYNSDQAGTGGLAAAYYNDTAQQRSFGTYKPAVLRRDPQIDFVWGSSASPVAPDPMLGTSWYLVRWTGNLTLPSTAPAGSYTPPRTYDTAGRVLSLTDLVSGSPRAFGFSYDSAGRLKTISRPNGVTTTQGYLRHEVAQFE